MVFISYLDHFILNERPFRWDVSSVMVHHTPDNLSDHDTMVITFDLNIELPTMLVNNYCKKFLYFSNLMNIGHI
jgi:hypothetical protein